MRFFAITDAEGNSLPDEIVVNPPYELPPKKYEYNEFGDVIAITDTTNPQSAADIITLTYDDIGNWIERWANGNSKFFHYLTTEHIYTQKSIYELSYISRDIKYYE